MFELGITFRLKAQRFNPDLPMGLRIAEMLTSILGALAAYFLPEAIVFVKLSNATFKVIKFSADESRFSLRYQLVKLMACRHNWNAASEHRLHHCASPRLFHPVSEGVKENVQTVKELEGGFVIFPQ